MGINLPAMAGSPDRILTVSEKTSKAGAREQIAYITYFRAIAILIIVAGHTYALAWDHFANENPMGAVSAFNAIPAFITGGTAFFVFISGFLYRQVFFGRIAYGDFMYKKALYVGLPYLLMATPFALLEIFAGEFTFTMAKEGQAYAPSLFVDYVSLMSTGRMVTAYWYIPFIFLVFAASPLFDRFIASRPLTKAVVFAAALGTALWIHRPPDNLNPVQSFFYFAHYYLFGMIFWSYRDALITAMKRPAVQLALALALLAITVTQAVVLDQVGNLERTGGGWAPQGFDLMLFQKYIAILLLCGLLARWGSAFHRSLTVIADYSFGVFFLHGIVLAVLNRMPAKLSPHSGNAWLDLLIYTAVVFAASLAIAATAKRLLGGRSRYVIGC